MKRNWRPVNCTAPGCDRSSCAARAHHSLDCQPRSSSARCCLHRIRKRSASKSLHGVEDRRHPPYLAALVGADLTRGNRYEVLTNGDQIFPPMLAAIDAAERRISFETYIYSDGSVADQFTAALERAARRGVKVTIVVDSVGAISIGSTHEQRLRSAGATLYTSIRHAGHARRNELPHSSQDSRHRRRCRVHGRRRRRRSLAGQRAGRRALARHSGPDAKARSSACSRACSTRTSSRASGEAGHARVDDDPGGSTRGNRRSLRSSPTGGSSDLKRLYLL